MARPSASSESTASTTCARVSSRACVNSRTSAAGSQCPPRTASVSSRRTACASVSWATASASALGTGATGTPATGSGTGITCARTSRTQPVERSRRVRGTSTSIRSSESSGGAEEKRCRASAASPVTTASHGAACAWPWAGIALARSGAGRPAYSRAACSRSSLVGGPGCNT